MVHHCMVERWNDGTLSLVVCVPSAYTYMYMYVASVGATIALQNLHM